METTLGRCNVSLKTIVGDHGFVTASGKCFSLKVNSSTTCIGLLYLGCCVVKY